MAGTFYPVITASDLDLGLLDAAKYGPLSEIARLLHAGADVNARDHRDSPWNVTPLMYAAGRGDLNAVKLLLRRGANVSLRDRSFPGENRGGRNAIHYATDSRNPAIIRILLESGGNINATPKEGPSPPLQSAVENDDVPLARFLLNNGADPNLHDRGTGTTPLHAAASMGSMPLIKLLLRSGAKVNGRDAMGDTPFVAAANNEHIDAMRLLINHGTDLRLKQNRGLSILMWAVLSRSEEIVKFLLRRGAEINALDDKGRTALDIAIRDGLHTIIYLLEKKNAKRGEELGGAPRSEALSNLSIEAPDFDRAAQSAEFQSAVRGLSEICGAEPNPLLPGYKGGVSFSLPAHQIKEILQKEHWEYMNVGFYLFECQFEQQIGLLPTTDKYDVIAVMQTNAVNVNLGTRDIVDWLREFEKEQRFELTGIGSDFLSGKFTGELRDSKKIAIRLRKFCPDLVDQGTGSVAGLALELKKTKRFFLWWD